MKSVAVFCGARAGNSPFYVEAARQLGSELAQRGLSLVYGGGHVGLMGTVADACLAAGGKVVGVIPQFMVERELAMTGLSELHITDSMHSRKALMAERADAFIALPGGFGTLDELFEILTWRQIGLHDKPIGLLNIQGYYTELLGFIKHAVKEGFVSASDSANLLMQESPSRLLDDLARQPQGKGGQWTRG